MESDFDLVVDLGDEFPVLFPSATCGSSHDVPEIMEQMPKDLGNNFIFTIILSLIHHKLDGATVFVDIPKCVLFRRNVRCIYKSRATQCDNC
jgi:hypothetical protein